LDTEQPSARGRGRSPSLAALLSFLWPGLGQLYTGKRRAAALFAVPAVLVLLLLVYELRQGLVVFGARFADPAFSRDAAAIVVLLGAWRLAAVVHAFGGIEQLKIPRNLDRLAVVALVAVIVISHAGAGYVLSATSDALSPIFNPGSSFVDLATTDPGSSAWSGPAASPLPTPAAAGRVTILFTGTSSGDSSNLYDTIMVVSYDPKTDSVQMISVPRDSASFPLYFGGVDSASTKINSLPTYVRNGSIKSPDSPYMTLVKEVSYLVGIPINYYAVMYVNGFVKMIDMVGGIDVNNPKVIDDSTYDWLDGSPYGFYLSAGPHHLDGRHALAYVRSRHTIGDYDWGRSSRQQEVLVDLLHKMSQPSQLLNLPKLISTLGSSVTTNFPANKVADYVAIGQSIPSQNFKQVVLGPPYTILNITTVTAATCLLNDKVAALSIQFFGQDSLWYGKPTPANTCP
jgi:LCP family protein required for cell wall assembly